MNVLKPALSISILIHILYILGILFFANYKNIAFPQGEIPIFLLFSTFVFAAIISLILRAIGSNTHIKS
ncbi:hypothetical protein G3A_05775 [Bacillus sp. 17376]|uniref:Uncharacterized protein n=1 Tax=Mesobacillus boroniphilus JCM 21738 TaxID=1294265 RepID=W4RTG6_9BACI|nr:hypothetical protein [Mesobacillus boroniphilus]ESU33519.1 hypothetical protein G3A_05775 [Bacillus sp. 17376]GAE47397.1 hypothetical protein JCM21738_4376 [Mesobacillus boroniphilus JCM 21738]